MSTAATTRTTRHELARRGTGDLEVALFWDTRADGITIELRHSAISEPISFSVPSDLALDAFHHPFAHLQQRLWRDSR